MCIIYYFVEGYGLTEKHKCNLNNPRDLVWFTDNSIMNNNNMQHIRLVRDWTKKYWIISCLHSPQTFSETWTGIQVFLLLNLKEVSYSIYSSFWRKIFHSFFILCSSLLIRGGFPQIVCTPDSLLLQCDSKPCGGGQMPARRHWSNSSELPEAQHTPHTKFTLCGPPRQRGEAAWGILMNSPLYAASLSLAAVKSIGHPFVLFWTILKCISVCKGFHMRTESRSVSCAVEPCRLFIPSCHVSYLYMNTELEGDRGRLGGDGGSSLGHDWVMSEGAVKGSRWKDLLRVVILLPWVWHHIFLRESSRGR